MQVDAKKSSTFGGTYSDSGITDNRTWNIIEWWDGAQYDVVYYKADIGSGTTWDSDYTYDPSGRLSSVAIDDGGADRTQYYISDTSGQVIVRWEDNAYTPGGVSVSPRPHLSGVRQ